MNTNPLGRGFSLLMFLPLVETGEPHSAPAGSLHGLEGCCQTGLGWEFIPHILVSWPHLRPCIQQPGPGEGVRLVLKSGVCLGHGATVCLRAGHLSAPTPPRQLTPSCGPFLFMLLPVAGQHQGRGCRTNIQELSSDLCLTFSRLMSLGFTQTA